jgi:hypothetical protein
VVPAANSRMRFWRNTSVATTPAGQSATLTSGCTCLLGYEWDADLDNGARPPGLVRLSTTTAAVARCCSTTARTTAPGRSRTL